MDEDADLAAEVTRRVAEARNLTYLADACGVRPCDAKHVAAVLKTADRERPSGPVRAECWRLLEWLQEHDRASSE